MVRRIVLGLAVGTSVFAIGLAMAASIGGLSLANLGADDGSVSSCDTDGMTATYTVAYDATDLRLEVTAVAVTGIATGCSGKTLAVAITNSSGTSIGSGSATISTTSATVTLSTAPSAELAANVHMSVT
ncbi:MAG: hypothetical protein HYU28_02015 [Actinobacteria bacterium]|nr:hypothetical protein [Actinomycetota bacterium]